MKIELNMARVEAFDREEIISKAMRVFWEKGYNGTSIQDLVDATGLNRSSIYNSFGSKHQLYKTSLKTYEDQGNRIFRKALLKSSNPLEALRKILESVIPAIAEDKTGKGCFIMNCKSEMGNTDLELKQWLSENQEKSISLFRELVNTAQEEGLISKRNDPTSYAYLLFNTLQGLRMTAILTPDKEILQNIIDETLKSIQ